MTPADLADPIRRLAEQAGAAIMEIYAHPFTAAEKADGSPVTAADLAADQIICEGLTALTPDVPIVSEERTGGLAGGVSGTFWLVDPLDGTREFIVRNGEFTVNIALIADGAPVMGCIHIPAAGETYLGWLPDQARGWRHGKGGPIAARRKPAAGAIAVASRHNRDAETDRVLAENGIRDVLAVGSALKFCRVAEGQADLYPRFGPTCEWDTAAGHALVLAAGGTVTTWDGDALTYGKPGFRNPGFIVRGRD